VQDDDLTPRERAQRNPSYRSGWEHAESEGRLEPEDVLGRLAFMALSEFGEGQDEWRMAVETTSGSILRTVNAPRGRPALSHNP
jgi:hypothetical protein